VVPPRDERITFEVVACAAASGIASFGDDGDQIAFSQFQMKYPVRSTEGHTISVRVVY
jgi:hypothetical protein